MKKTPITFLLSLFVSLFFLVEITTPDVSAIKGDNMREHVVIVKTEFSPYTPTRRNIRIGTRHTFTWVNDPQLQAPSKTVLSFNSSLTNKPDVSNTAYHSEYLRPFRDVDFPSVGNYIFKVRSEIISQSVDGKAMPWADGTQYVMEAKEYEVIVAIRSADPQYPGQNLTLQIVTKEDIILPVHLNQTNNAEVTVAHHTKGLMGEKDKLFDYEVDITGLPDAVAEIVLNGKTRYLVSNQALCDKVRSGVGPDVQIDCTKAVVSLKDGESFTILNGLMPGDKLFIRQVDSQANYVTSVNNQTGVSSKQIEILPTNNPLAASSHTLSFESRREGSPATGIVLKAAPFVGIAGMGGIGGIVIYKTRKRR